MGLFENVKNESIGRLNLRTPVTVRGDETLDTVIGKMRAAELGCAIEVDEQQRPLGMFTESMLTQLVAENRNYLSDPVRNHVASQWPWVNMNDPVQAVLEALEAKNVRFLCVVDDSGKLVGLAGQKGLVEYIAEHFPQYVMVQRVGQKPYMSEKEGA